MLTLFLSVSGIGFSRFAKKCFAQAEQEKPFDAIIVPGVLYKGKETSAVMAMRLHWAKYLYDHGFTRRIIFSGSAVHTPYVESIVMKKMIVSLGVDPDHVFTETEAQHGTENLYFSSKLARGLGFHKVALATDAFQAAMLRSFMKKHIPDLRCLPIVDGKIDLKTKGLPDVDVGEAFVQDFVPLSRRESFFKRMRGSFGLRVREMERSTDEVAGF